MIDDDDLREFYGNDIVICPISFSPYVFCDKDCENCDTYRDFLSALGLDDNHESLL